MKQVLIYSSKVWLTTVVLGMRVAALIKILLDTDHLIYKVPDIFNTAIYDIPVGLIVCLPPWLLFALFERFLERRLTKGVIIKIWLSLIALLLIVLPFAILFWHQLTHINYLPDMMPLLIAYIIVTIAGIWFYKLEPNSAELKTTS